MDMPMSHRYDGNKSKNTLPNASPANQLAWWDAIRPMAAASYPFYPAGLAISWRTT